MYWQAQVVAFLRDCKDHGWDFDAAWQTALLKYPPRGTGFGNGRKQQTLFTDEAEEPSLTEFLEMACRTAWNNEKPELAGLSAELLDVPVGDELRAHGRHRQTLVRL
jgi:hypothetical protein